MNGTIKKNLASTIFLFTFLMFQWLKQLLSVKSSGKNPFGDQRSPTGLGTFSWSLFVQRIETDNAKAKFKKLRTKAHR